MKKLRHCHPMYNRVGCHYCWNFASGKVTNR